MSIWEKQVFDESVLQDKSEAVIPGQCNWSLSIVFVSLVVTEDCELS